MENLSDDILIEIFTTLSVKSLMRCKCVSKAWNTIIGHPNFVRSRTEARLLFQLKAYPKRSVPYIIHNNPVTSKREVFPLELNGFCYDGDQMSICSNHCNGLVCLYSYRYTEVYLYNVTTREKKPLPHSMILGIRSKQYTSDPKLFLGFDGNYYKLLHVFYRRGAKECEILTLGVIDSSWKKIVDVINESNSYCNSCDLYMECIFLNGVVYWYSSKSCVVYFNFREEKFGYILSPNPPTSYSFKGLHSMQSALWGKLVISCRSHIDDVGTLFHMVYDDANEVFTRISPSEDHDFEVVARLPGAESIKNDDTKEEADVLATASVNCASDSLFSSSRPCYLRFVGNYKCPLVKFNYVSSFVENIIPLSSLLV